MNIHDWKPEVGMEVFIASDSTRRAGRKDRITKVGRTYFYVGTWNRKFSIETKVESTGYGAQSICYRSEEDYNRHMEIQKHRQYVEYHLQGKLTDEQIEIIYGWIKDKI